MEDEVVGMKMRVKRMTVRRTEAVGEEGGEHDEDEKGEKEDREDDEGEDDEEAEEAEEDEDGARGVGRVGRDSKDWKGVGELEVVGKGSDGGWMKLEGVGEVRLDSRRLSCAGLI